MQQTDPLARVRRAAAARRRAELEYRAALVDAVAALETSAEPSPANGRPDPFARVAGAAGTSRQAVRQLVARVRS